MARRMTVVFDDEDLYTALKLEAVRSRRPAKDIVAEAVQAWFRALGAADHKAAVSMRLGAARVVPAGDDLRRRNHRSREARGR